MSYLYLTVVHQSPKPRPWSPQRQPPTVQPSSRAFARFKSRVRVRARERACACVHTPASRAQAPSLQQGPPSGAPTPRGLTQFATFEFNQSDQRALSVCKSSSPGRASLCTPPPLDTPPHASPLPSPLCYVTIPGDALSPHHSPTPQTAAPYPRQAAMIRSGEPIPHRAEQEAPMRAPLSPQPARPRLATAHAGALLASLARRPGLKLGTHAPVPNLASGVCVHALLARVVLERPVPLRHLEQRLHVRVRVSCEQVACVRSPGLMGSSVRARTAARGARHASQRPAP